MPIDSGALNRKIAMSESEIDGAKNRFLDRYNPDRSIDVAVARAIGAAVQHNPLYRPNLAHRARDEWLEIRRVWSAYLQLIAARIIAARQKKDLDPFLWEYPNAGSLLHLEYSIVEDTQDSSPREEITEDYARLIYGLRSAMNSYFATCFRETGFRISHSQKSVSVFLKHLWCMGRAPMPIQCPVDRNILRMLPDGANFGPWTRIDHISTHLEIITKLDRLAQPTPVAVWELLIFQPI